MKKNCATLLFLFAIISNSYGANDDFLHQTGKINTVILVIATIFVGIIIYLIRLDIKLNKIENQINKNHESH
jgi:CcmD family protein